MCHLCQKLFDTFPFYTTFAHILYQTQFSCSIKGKIQNQDMATFMQIIWCGRKCLISSLESVQEFVNKDKHPKKPLHTI